jgi:2-phosphosulfolactate phosphatase
MSNEYLRVHKLPRDVREEDLAGSCVVVIDLLRATSTICQALAAGAREVVPFLEVDDALNAANKTDRSDIVLGGERRGGKIPGFDVGNSPSEYTRDVVGGKRVFITTTNGTRAMHHARLAKRIVLSSFLNLTAVVASIKDEPRIDILCAGTDGGETGEDILAAGAIIQRLMDAGGANSNSRLSESAVEARDLWKELVEKAREADQPLNVALAVALRDTAGGRNLLGMGLDQDLVDCSQIDSITIVPELDVRTWRIVGTNA